jgi:hypothetical protein
MSPGQRRLLFTEVYQDFNAKSSLFNRKVKLHIRLVELGTDVKAGCGLQGHQSRVGNQKLTIRDAPRKKSEMGS